MKVFLSWSDQTSHKVASALRDWLPYVIQAIDPFLSSENINKGERWNDELVNQLKETCYGIICLTRHNINAAWMNFEAGAISNAIKQSCVSPFLFYVESAKVVGPLQQFQFTVYGKDDGFNKEEVFKLVSGINNTLNQQVPHERLRRQFEKWWCELKEKLDKVLVNSEVESIAGHRWLFLPEDIITIQARVDCKSVWVIASNLYQYSLHPAVQDVVQRNMKRDVVYTYIIADSEQNVPFVHQFNEISATHSNHPTIRRIPEDQFNSLAAADYIIVNPDCGDRYQLQMFIELPIASEDKYWMEVENQAALKFVTRFQPLTKEDKVLGS